ncbi:MAG: hypothetical protein ACYTGL_19785 [Planctomycetota bacterium]
MIDTLFSVVLSVLMIIVVGFFVQRSIDVLRQFVGLTFDVFSRFVEARFVQMADGLMQQFQPTVSMLGPSTVLMSSMFVMPFTFNRFGMLKQLTQFSFDGFRSFCLTGFTQLGNVMSVSLNLDLQPETLHAPLDFPFDSFCFFSMTPLTEFSSFTTHRFNVLFKLFVFTASPTIAAAFPLFQLSSLGTFPVSTFLAVPLDLFPLFAFLSTNSFITFSIILSTNGQEHSTNTAGHRSCHKHSTKRHGLSPD